MITPVKTLLILQLFNYKQYNDTKVIMQLEVLTTAVSVHYNKSLTDQNA